jgi:hypothetical protein
MDERMNISEHIDVMVGKTFAMMRFVKRLSFEFRVPYTLPEADLSTFIRIHINHIFLMGAMQKQTPFNVRKFFIFKQNSLKNAIF